MLCFVVVMQSFIMNSHEVFIHIHQGCFAGTGAIVRLPQCQWSKPDGYGKISQCITTTKHSKAKTVCICLGIYCNCHELSKYQNKFPGYNLWPTNERNRLYCDYLPFQSLLTRQPPVWALTTMLWFVILMTFPFHWKWKLTHWSWGDAFVTLH